MPTHCQPSTCSRVPPPERGTGGDRFRVVFATSGAAWQELADDRAEAGFTEWCEHEASIFKRHRTGDVARLAAAGAAVAGPLIRKRFWYPTAADRWRGLLRTTCLARSRVEGEARALEQLAALGLQPRLLVAFGERRRAGFLLDSFLCLRELPALPLDRVLADPTRASDHAAIVARLADHVAAWHAAGFVDRDLHLRNFLVADDGSLAKIDSPFARRMRRPWRNLQQRRERAALAAEIAAAGGTALLTAFRPAAAAAACRG